MNKRFTPSQLAAFLATLAIPAAVIARWHLLNHYYPRQDSAFYFNTMDALQTIFRTKGLFAYLIGCYETRVGRAVLHPPLYSPVLLLCGGNIRLALLLANELAFAF